MKWKIYYEDGTVFTDEDGTVEEAPARGVLCIAQEDPLLGRRLEAKQEFYVWTEAVGWKRGWTAVNQWGLMDFLIELGLVKLGRMTDNERFSKALNQAAKEPGLPDKSAWREEERDLFGGNN